MGGFKTSRMSDVVFATFHSLRSSRLCDVSVNVLVRRSSHASLAILCHACLQSRHTSKLSGDLFTCLESTVMYEYRTPPPP